MAELIESLRHAKDEGARLVLVGRAVTALQLNRRDVAGSGETDGRQRVADRVVVGSRGASRVHRKLGRDPGLKDGAAKAPAKRKKGHEDRGPGTELFQFVARGQDGLEAAGEDLELRRIEGQHVFARNDQIAHPGAVAHVGRLGAKRELQFVLEARTEAVLVNELHLGLALAGNDLRLHHHLGFGEGLVGLDQAPKIEVARRIPVGGLAESAKVDDHRVEFLGRKGLAKSRHDVGEAVLRSAVLHHRLPQHGRLAGGAAVRE